MHRIWLVRLKKQEHVALFVNLKVVSVRMGLLRFYIDARVTLLCWLVSKTSAKVAYSMKSKPKAKSKSRHTKVKGRTPSVPPPESSPASGAKPLRYGWLFEETFKVQVGSRMIAFERYPCERLYELVHSKNANKVPHSQPELFYAAQLLHYGLPPAVGLNSAVDTLRKAFVALGQSKSLPVPASIQKLQEALKAAYDERAASLQVQQRKEIEEALEAAKQRQKELKEKLDKLNADAAAKLEEVRGEAQKEKSIVPAEPAQTSQSSAEGSSQAAKPVETSKKRKASTEEPNKVSKKQKKAIAAEVSI